MEHPIHRFALGREIEHRRGVLHVALHAHGQGLDALQQVEGVGGGKQAPKSRKPSARARMMKAAGPNSSAKTMP